MIQPVYSLTSLKTCIAVRHHKVVAAAGKRHKKEAGNCRTEYDRHELNRLALQSVLS